jgi:predicted nucleic acid-binding protein
VTGLADVLLAAKRAGFLTAVRPVIERLARRGFTLPEASVRTVLDEAGEADASRGQ